MKVFFVFFEACGIFMVVPYKKSPINSLLIVVVVVVRIEDMFIEIL